MRAATTLRLATAGSRVDGLRIVLTAAGAALTTLALLAALTVAAIGPDDGPYTASLLNEDGLRPGVVIALLGLCVPVLVLLAQCSRIGAPARDRRLAAVRLAGASPAQVTRVVAVEAGLSALPGSLLGVAVHTVLRAALDERVAGDVVVYRGSTGSTVADSALRLPTDVTLPWLQVALVAVAVPALVVLATAWALRPVAFTPFGMVRRSRTRSPRMLPLALVGAGLGLLGAVRLVDRTSDGLSIAPFTILAFVGVGLATVGLLAGQGALTRLIGRHLAARTSRPALLLAGRRMVSDPFAATRATAVLTVAVLLAAGARYLRDAFLTVRSDDEDFFAGAYDLVDLVLLVAGGLAVLGLLVAVSEGLVARRRTYAAVVAAGTPRGVVGRALLAEVLVPLVPSLLIAMTVGTLGAVGLFGRTAEMYDPTINMTRETVVELAWGPLTVTYLLAIGAAALTTSLSLLFLRTATDIGEIRAAA